VELHPVTLTKDRERLVRAVAKRIERASRGPGYQALGFTLLPSEIRAAAEAAVDAFAEFER
jgi:hypothetical protein